MNFVFCLREKQRKQTNKQKTDCGMMLLSFPNLISLYKYSYPNLSAFSLNLIYLGFDGIKLLRCSLYSEDAFLPSPFCIEYFVYLDRKWGISRWSEACHRLKKKENVIIKFKSRKLKYKVINNRKRMKNKSNLCISESMCAGNHGLFFKCRKLKKARKIFNTWFFNNAVNIQLNQSGEIHKVFHTEDLAALLKVDDLDSFLMNLYAV